MKKNNSERLFPEGFKYWNTNWYKMMIKEMEDYRYKILLYSYGIGMLVPVMMLFNDIKTEDYTYVLNHIIPFIVLLSIFIYLLKSKDIKRISILAIFTIGIGFVLSLFLPGGELSYFLTFVLFPPIVFQIKGVKNGLKWSLSFFILASLCFIIAKLGIIKAWSNNIESTEIAMGILVYVLLFIIIYAREKEYEKYMQKFLNRINFDDVTNLANREVLINSIENYKKDTFVIIRILNFNDLISLFGYELSDEILRFVSKEIVNLSEEFSIKIFKLLSDDFGLIFSEDIRDKFEVKMRLKELLTKLESISMRWEDKDINLVYGIGASEINNNSLDRILSNADQSLKDGISENIKVSIYSEKSVERLRSLDSFIKLSKLIENKELDGFLAVYQPILNTQSQKLEWYEALLRVKNGDRYESIYPYLEVAKSTGFYGYITDFILKNACEFIKTTKNSVSINISFIDILNPLFFYILEKNISLLKEDNDKLILEIVETEEMKDQEKIIDFIKKVKDMGCLLAIDDFGSGYSNFANLINLPFDILKVDGELIRKIAVDSDALAMLESIVWFCKKTNKRIVAEYVEDEKIYNIVREIGIDYVQGYYFGKPESMKEMNIKL